MSPEPKKQSGTDRIVWLLIAHSVPFIRWGRIIVEFERATLGKPERVVRAWFEGDPIYVA